MSEEQVVLLDDAGHAIGTAAKRLVHHQTTPLHLAFSCYVFDASGSVLLTRRALQKATWPGAWTNSFCGHPAPGEAWPQALSRRARQELGIELSSLAIALPAFRYRAVMDNGVVENEICPVFTAVTTDQVRADPAEVAAVEWVEWPVFRAEVLAGERAVSPWCADQVRQLSDDEPHPPGGRSTDWSALPPRAG